MFYCKIGHGVKRSFISDAKRLCLCDLSPLKYNIVTLQNEMNRALDHFCAHIGEIGPREPTEDVEMSEMTLPSRHRMIGSISGFPTIARNTDNVAFRRRR